MFGSDTQTKVEKMGQPPKQFTRKKWVRNPIFGVRLQDTMRPNILSEYGISLGT